MAVGNGNGNGSAPPDDAVPVEPASAVPANTATKVTPKLQSQSSKMSLSKQGSSTSLASGATVKACFSGPNDNLAGSKLTMANFAAQEKLTAAAKADIKGAQSISKALMNKSEAQHDKDGIDGEARLLDVTKGPTLSSKVAKQAKLVTTSVSNVGAEKRVLMGAIMEIQGEVRTCRMLPWSIIFFMVFTFTCQMHYRTYAIHLQETNLRNHVTGDAEECGEVQSVFEWLDGTFFPFLWSAPNVAGSSSILPSRDLTVLGGVMLRVAEGPREPCQYVQGQDCYPQDTRDATASFTLNGWTRSIRRLSTEDEPDADKGWAGYLAESWVDFRDAWLPDGDSELWTKPRNQKPAEVPKTPRSKRTRQISRAREQRPTKQRPTKPRRALKGGLEGLWQKRDKKDKKKRFGWLTGGVDKARLQKLEKQQSKARRMAVITSDLVDIMPEPGGYDKTFTTVIPMSMPLNDVSAKLAEWQTEGFQLVRESSLLFGVEAIVLNEDTDVLTHMFVTFLFSRGGEVFTQVRLNSMIVETSYLAIAAGTVWALMLFSHWIMLVVQVATSLKNGVAGEHLKKLSTLLEWLIGILGVFICVSIAIERAEMMRANVLREEYMADRVTQPAIELEAFDSSWLRKLHSILYVSGKLDVDLLLTICLYHVMLLFWFLITSQGHPRLALLANTLAACFQDIVHLFIVFLFIFSAYVISGHIMFGSMLYQYSTVKGAFARALQQVVSAETNFDVLTMNDWWTNAIWIWTLTIIVGLIVINIVLAVVFDAYAKIHNFITEKDNVVETAKRQFTAFRLLSHWYSYFDLMAGVRACKSDIITIPMFQDIFKGITKEQVQHIFELAELRGVVETVKGHSTLLGEGIASILLGVDEMRDGVRLMQGKQFVSNREAKIWLDHIDVPLEPPPNVFDMGPGTYIVLHDNLEVRESKDVSSNILATLPRDLKVEVTFTEDYNGGIGLKRMMAKIQEPDGWICINDIESGYVWAEPWKEIKQEEDYPGIYTVLHDHAAVKSDISLGSIVVDHLAAGRMVEVVEVQHYIDHEEKATRVRARITSPDGWISLVDKDSNYRFAIRSSLQEPCGRYSVLQDRTAVRSGPGLMASVLRYFNAGEVVNVVEVRRYSDNCVDPPEERVTGRVDEEEGWITLMDLQSGHRFAEMIPGKAPMPKRDLTDVARVPRDPPGWVKDGLLMHLQRQQRVMIQMTEQFQQIQLGLDRLGVSDGWQAPIPLDKPKEPQLQSMLVPARHAMKDPDAAAIRRPAPCVNLPRPSASPSAQMPLPRLGHFVRQEI